MKIIVTAEFDTVEEAAAYLGVVGSDTPAAPDAGKKRGPGRPRKTETADAGEAAGGNSATAATANVVDTKDAGAAKQTVAPTTGDIADDVVRKALARVITQQPAKRADAIAYLTANGVEAASKLAQDKRQGFLDLCETLAPSA